MSYSPESDKNNLEEEYKRLLVAIVEQTYIDLLEAVKRRNKALHRHNAKKYAEAEAEVNELYQWLNDGTGWGKKMLERAEREAKQ